MFTSPAYSAVHSNNLQSRYPEGWCRLKMSNVLPAAWMRKCNADNSVSVWCCQARHQLLHTPPSTARKYKNSWERLVKGGIWKWPEVMSGLPASNLLFLGWWRGMMKHTGEYWSRWSNNTTSVRPNPTRSTCAPTYHHPRSMIPRLLLQPHVACKCWMIAHGTASMLTHHHIVHCLTVHPIVVFRLGPQIMTVFVRKWLIDILFCLQYVKKKNL